jgi:hypothetical protein
MDRQNDFLTLETTTEEISPEKLDEIAIAIAALLDELCAKTQEESR